MRSDVEEELIRHRGLGDLDASDVLFLTGAGISNPPPTSFPLGNDLHRLLLSNYSNLSRDEIETLIYIDSWTFEQTCEAILNKYQLLGYRVNSFWDLMSGIFNYDDTKAWKQPNDLHKYFHCHIEKGGRHFTANLDQFIEQNTMPYQVITPWKLENEDVPPNINQMVNQASLFKFHGDCNEDPEQLQGFLHSTIKDGFKENTRKFWSGVLQSVKLVCICGYGGVDRFDVNRYFEELPEKVFKATAIWISYLKDSSLEIVPYSKWSTSMKTILSRFSESFVLEGEVDELLNQLFQSSLPKIHRLSSSGYAQEYSKIFEINIEYSEQTQDFKQCREEITERLWTVIRDSPVLTEKEHEEARLIAYFNSLERGGGRLPQYDHTSATDDFCKAAAKVIASRKREL